MIEIITNGAGGAGGSGTQGVGVAGATVNANGHLILTLTNSTEIDAGSVMGTNGTTWLYGSNAPSSSIGIDGDFYLNEVNSYLYSKSNGVWTKICELKGTDGANGTSFLNGSGAPSSSLGNNGDSYLDTSAYDIYKKSSGTWSIVCNIKGANGSGIGDMLAATYATGTKTNASKVDHALLADEATKLSTARNIALTGDVTGTASFDGSGDASIAATLKTIDGLTAATYSGRLSVTVNAKGLVTSMAKIAEEPTTLNIPGGSGYASSGKICGIARTLPTVNVKFRNNNGTAATPSAATTIIVSKTVSGTTTTVATISGLTVADTVYTLSTPATIEAGARITAAFSGSNNGVAFADVEMVWGVA